MKVRPFLKWAGGKRWLVERGDFSFPRFDGTYIEPFLGSGAVFFSLSPKKALLSDVNQRLIEVYNELKNNYNDVVEILKLHQKRHSKEYYYKIRSLYHENAVERSAQFIYLNRTCWNGLYRENLKGEFNVPIGTKTKIAPADEDWDAITSVLKNAEVVCCDFESTIDRAGENDFLFVDPPYTTAHNLNGFVKYNQRIFTWSDQIRLRNSVVRAAERGAKVVVTNAHHDSILELYDGIGVTEQIRRASIISGKNLGRQSTSELIIRCNM
ncbi:DNA adenine methylase [Ensifer adhaerens]|nr:DNA adenine methylase [Ensifer adhaerens]